ncbi:hypothetical protein G6F56_009914 [Rhizopus delemar]|uniref:SH3 domain-containing protein n=1 Tax=Rhizopus stolonifer TaxID=4846 RepID=A0A367IUE6_RHIST|nr:hypothetical protein G6F56_009914 [Rhizopus delemar]RCH81304.1 hypothetical protein CU098_001903 [Rhizopus stolonifer]
MNSISPPTSPLVSTFTSHFVQALHDYLPSSAPITEEPVTCLFFKKGSIIEVFNRDNSGWWDGQCGEIRGWFPSNYVGRIGEAKRESVDFENEELTLWQQEKQQEKISARISFIVQVTNIMKELKKEYAREEMNTIQVLVFQLVSCIKAILVEFNIVDKDSPILKVYPELAKQRKTVFSTLNRLVLICKEQHKVQEELDVIADQLLYDLNQFERILQILPSFDDHSSSYSSRSSVNSLASNNYDKSSSSLLLSSFKLNTESILQSIFERQSALQDLISTLLVQLPLFLADRKQKTTNLLDITQRAIEAVKSFLSVVEHVCSNFEDLDKRLSLMIPDDPHLVSLVFAKESVYSAITNLVTAIRASTHPQLDQDPDGLELEHLIDCCQQVIKTTTECTKSCKNCLHPSEEEEPPPPYTEIPLRVPMDINRKISSLKAISQEIPERTLRPRASSVNGTKVPKRARGLSLSSLRSSLQKSTKSSAVSSESLPDWENKMPPASTPINVKS